MNCLPDIISGKTTIIGIRDNLHTSVPLSGLFINDIPGMSLKLLAASANEEQKTGYALAQQKILYAINLVIDDFRAYMFPHYALNTVITSTDSAEWSEEPLTFGLTPLSWKMQYERRDSRLAQMRLKGVELIYQNSIPQVDIMLRDGERLALIKSVAVVANVRQFVQLDEIINSEEFEVWGNFPQSTAPGAIGTVNYSGASCGTCRGSSPLLSVRSTVAGNSHGYVYGFRPLVELECSDAEIICTCIDKLYYLMFIRSGAEVFREASVSNRLNPIITFNAKSAKENYDDLMNQYDERFKLVMNNLVKFLGSFNDLCLTCKKNSIGYALP